ncbi:MAG: hypothetical protein ACYDHX_04115 [Methanothrix sp.]
MPASRVPAIFARSASSQPVVPPKPHPRRTCSSRPASDTNQRDRTVQPPCAPRPPWRASPAQDLAASYSEELNAYKK